MFGSSFLRLPSAVNSGLNGFVTEKENCRQDLGAESVSDPAPLNLFRLSRVRLLVSIDFPSPSRVSLRRDLNFLLVSFLLVFTLLVLQVIPPPPTHLRW